MYSNCICMVWCRINICDITNVRVYSTLALGKEREIVKEETALGTKDLQRHDTCTSYSWNIDR